MSSQTAPTVGIKKVKKVKFANTELVIIAISTNIEEKENETKKKVMRTTVCCCTSILTHGSVSLANCYVGIRKATIMQISIGTEAAK